jgi:hypothetical protein
MRLSNLSFTRVSAATAAWGIVFAVVHFYWAAGGDGAIGDDGSGLAASLYIGFIAVLGLLSAAVARGLDRPWGARIGYGRLAVLARVGGVALLLGVVVGVGRWIGSGTLGDDGAAGVAITAYFLLGAGLFAVLGWREATPARSAGPADLQRAAQEPC